MLRYFTVPRKGLGEFGGPPFAPDLPEGLSWVGEMSPLVADYLVAVRADALVGGTLPGATERFPGEDVRSAAAARGIASDPMEWRVER